MAATTGHSTGLLDAVSAMAAGEERVGGKAMGLARLTAAGANVPAWTVVPVAAFERHLAAAGIEGPAREEHAEAVLATPVEDALAAAVARAVGGRGAMAVRSSVVGEDSATASFAGMFDSHLSVAGAAQVVEAIRACWASAFSGRALSYRRERGEDLALPAMGVVIQELVEGEVSGVLFTVNPVSGRDDESLVSATWGLGEGVVSGACDTDEYVWGHDGAERSATVATKETSIVATRGGTQLVSVAPDLRDVRCLAPHTLDDLGRRALHVADALGSPQDIEWTLRDGELFLLQSRPVTATAPASPLGDRTIVWDNSNIQESFDGVTTPLTFSVAVRAYASVYEQTLRVLGVSERVLEEHRPVFGRMIGLVDGRVYYSIENWYRCLLLLPGFDRSKEDMERMMGLEHPVDLVAGTTLTRAERLRRLPGLARVGVRMALAFGRLERSVDGFLETFAARTGHIDRDRLHVADLGTLLALADRLDDEVVGDWTVPIVNDIYVMTITGRLRKIVTRAVGAAADEAVAGLLGGAEGIESMEPTRRLMAMAREIAAAPALAEALELEPASAALEALRERSPSLDADLADFLDRYGDRCMGEMKLETVSLRQDASFVVHVLRNFAARPDLDPAALSEHEQARRESVEAEILAALPARSRPAFRRALAKARSAVKWRENMRLSRTRFVGLYRDIYLAAGERLAEAGVLADARDVLYITREELSAWHEGTSVGADLAGLAALRKAEYAGYEDRLLPNHFTTNGSPYHGPRVAPLAAGPVTAGRVLHGIGCSAGTVEGQVRVVLRPDDDLDVNGRILTTVRTDPGWTPLFPSAAGLLIERGSTLSHSAVLAREFGIPCVVGIPGLLEIVDDGERVRLDGGSGLVERL